MTNVEGMTTHEDRNARPGGLHLGRSRNTMAKRKGQTAPLRLIVKALHRKRTRFNVATNHEALRFAQRFNDVINHAGHSWFAIRHSAFPIGNTTRILVPLPSSLSASTRPPCNWAICFTIASPRPVPPSSRPRALSAR